MIGFRKRIRVALDDPQLQDALGSNARRRREGRRRAFETLPDAEILRLHARQIRIATIQQLDRHLNTFISQLETNGVKVHRALDAAEAQKVVLQIAKHYSAQLIVKSKSMVSEEIGLNTILKQQGLQVIETDLGEYIVQLRNEPPSHIITPALHLNREQVADTFSASLGIPYSTDVADLNRAAHEALRDVFLDADIGISGVNFGIAETGTLCLITNEGNGRMVTSLPPVHIALMGIERLLPTLTDLAPMLALLPRSATGQLLSSYVTLLHGPRQTHSGSGPQARHLILIDNHRTDLLHSPLEDALLCIRCGACLNACPVFENLGGHAYASTYPGPIGSVLSPGMWGVEHYGHLASASTLCGLCQEVCPVEIDLPGLLLETRRTYRESVPHARRMRWVTRLFKWLMISPWRYRLAKALAGTLLRLFPSKDGWLRWAPPPLRAWSQTRDFPLFQATPDLDGQPCATVLPSIDSQQGRLRSEGVVDMANQGLGSDVERWVKEFMMVNGEVQECRVSTLTQALASFIRGEGATEILYPEVLREAYPELTQGLQQAGIELIEPAFPQATNDDERGMALRQLDAIPFGITMALAGLADTGSIILSDPRAHSDLASLLPRTHIVLLQEDALYPNLSLWIPHQKKIQESGTTILITGPSRTADIEMTLSIGVHGPARVVVFLIR